MRQVWRAVQAIPQALLVQPEHVSYDLAFGLALVPPLAAGMLFFRRSAILLIALCFLSGIVCLLALQLARLTLGLPAWVGYRAHHPLIASLMVACFLSPQSPPWLGVSLVLLLVVLDQLLWPPLGRMMIAPPLVVFGLLFLVQRQLSAGFVNPFDGRRLDDPLTLWHRLGLLIDPIKLYVGNVPGPIGATSAGALLIGIAYLWYTRKISLSLLAGFLCGVTAVALAYRFDVARQLSSGPALFLVGYIACDRRRLVLADRFTFVAGTVAGGITVVLRNYGLGQEATWQSLLFVGVIVTLGLRVQMLLTHRLSPGRQAPALRPLAVTSGMLPGSSPAPSLRQPAMAALSGTPTLRRTAPVQPPRRYDTATDPNDLVRQMRRSAGRGPLRRAGGNPVIWTLALFLVNPIGLWLTWTSGALSRRTKSIVSGASALWYLAVAGLFLAVTHGWLRA